MRADHDDLAAGPRYVGHHISVAAPLAERLKIRPQSGLPEGRRDIIPSRGIGRGRRAMARADLAREFIDMGAEALAHGPLLRRQGRQGREPPLAGHLRAKDDEHAGGQEQDRQTQDAQGFFHFLRGVEAGGQKRGHCSTNHEVHRPCMNARPKNFLLTKKMRMIIVN